MRFLEFVVIVIFLMMVILMLISIFPRFPDLVMFVSISWVANLVAVGEFAVDCFLVSYLRHTGVSCCVAVVFVKNPFGEALRVARPGGACNRLRSALAFLCRLASLGAATGPLPFGKLFLRNTLEET